MLFSPSSSLWNRGALGLGPHFSPMFTAPSLFAPSTPWGFGAADRYFGPTSTMLQAEMMQFLLNLLILYLLLQQMNRGAMGLGFPGLLVASLWPGAGRALGGDMSAGPSWGSRSRISGWGSDDTFDPREGANPVTEDPVGAPPGAVAFRGAMAIDGDGSFDPRASRDPAWQGRTSLKWNGRSADANQIPYVVLSPSAARSIGANLGDLVRVRANGRTVYAIYADSGPRVGEASMRTARALGINDSPIGGGKSGGVEYTVLPGSGARIRSMARPPTYDEIQAMGKMAFGDQDPNVAVA
jgi:glycosyl hydrolase group 75 (putative chitosanase)